MNEEILLAIDIGTSSCKLAAFTKDGEALDTDTEFYKVYYPQEGWAEQNPDDWWSAICACTKRMCQRGKVKFENIKGIGIDGQSWDAIPIDLHGNVLAPTPIWMDTRAKEICQSLANSDLGRKFFEVSGNPLQPTYSLPKVLWFKENKPEIYKKTAKFLQSNSYIVYKLTGEISQDISQSYGYQFFDMRNGTYNNSFIEELGLDRDKFPEIFNCHEVVGEVTAQASNETYLPQGIPVVAGGLDAACGALGVGVINNEETQEQGGQAGGMSICLDEYKADPSLILSFHVVPNKWLLQGGTVGGAGVPRWFLKQFGYEESEKALKNNTNPYYELDVIAKKIKPGAEGLLFLPYMSGERSPIWNSEAKAVFYGIDFTKTKGHFVRAIEEGGALALHHNLSIAEAQGINISELRSMGGAANSRLWMQIKADVTGKKMLVASTDSATTLGAAILAGVGVGMYSNFEEAISLTSKKAEKFYPNKQNYALYQGIFEKYLKLYNRLLPLMNEK